MPSPNDQTLAPPASNSGADTADSIQGEPDQSPLTQGQAEAILADLKTVKQRLLWVLIILGLFIARAIFFHY
jgi:hypothetical protein